MTRLQDIFTVFSRRPEVQSKPRHEIPQTTRNRVFMWCREIFSGQHQSGGFGLVGRGGDFTQEFWLEIHRRLLYRTGGVGLPDESDPIRQTFYYLSSCPGENFLDFLEDLFKVECYFHVAPNENVLVGELNELLRVDNLPYHVTHFVKETVDEGGGRWTLHIRAYPQVIMKESEVLHASAITPALSLLQQPHFRNANTEFLNALEDYRKGDNNDCLTKCGSAFESVLKVICDRKGWKYKQTDTAKPLLDIVLPHTKLDGYFKDVLLIVATLRNRLSSSHGAGTVAKNPEPHVAQYALNVTASAILLLAQETGVG